jgi:hypothetical protein
MTRATGILSKMSRIGAEASSSGTNSGSEDWMGWMLTLGGSCRVAAEYSAPAR